LQSPAVVPNKRKNPKTGTLLKDETSLAVYDRRTARIPVRRRPVAPPRLLRIGELAGDRPRAVPRGRARGPFSTVARQRCLRLETASRGWAAAVLPWRRP
jgi:hypothetical protein